MRSDTYNTDLEIKGTDPGYGFRVQVPVDLRECVRGIKLINVDTTWSNRLADRTSGPCQAVLLGVSNPACR